MAKVIESHISDIERAFDQFRGRSLQPRDFINAIEFNVETIRGLVEYSFGREVAEAELRSLARMWAFGAIDPPPSAAVLSSPSIAAENESSAFRALAAFVQEMQAAPLNEMSRILGHS